MAKRITPEQIEEINELYVKLKVKKKVAEIVGVSPSTVSKYILPDYVPKAERKTVALDIEPRGIGQIVEIIKNSSDRPAKAFADACKLSEDEWAELKEMQKEITV